MTLHRACLMAVIDLALASFASAAEPTNPHPWRPPFGLERVGFVGQDVDASTLPKLEADAIARPDKIVNPVDLGTILVPTGWLLLGEGQSGELEVAAISRKADEPELRVRAWFTSVPDQSVTSPMPLQLCKVARKSIELPPTPRGRERDELRVILERSDSTEVWHKTIPVMLVEKPPQWPRFGATRTKLRYDATISVRGDDNSFSSLPYEQGWDEKFDDVVVSLPNGSRFVFWRGSCYIPFWAGQHNTGLSYEWAETSPPKDGFTDCVEPLMDKQLRYGRVEIIESTAARVHVRWSYQSCDFKYKVWGDSAVEDFYFYPDGFGSRVLTLRSALDGDYELSEFIILTPQGTYPFSVLPSNLVDILFLDVEKRELNFPYFPNEQGQKLQSKEVPSIYRVRLHKDESTAAVYFQPLEQKLPPVVFAPFQDEGQIVTPCYWGSHWPLARGQTTGGAINDRVHSTPCHNSIMSWARQRPAPLREATLTTLDTLGRSKPMRVQVWSWLIGLTDAPDAQLLDWARSYAALPSISLEGARLDDEPGVPERRAVCLVAEAPTITVTLTPETVCVNPVLEIRNAAPKLRQVRLDDQPLAEDHWAWDGRTLWVEATLRKSARLVLQLER